MTQKIDIWNRRTRWRSGFYRTQNIQENFNKLESLKTSNSSICLELIGTNGSYHLSGEKLVNSGNDQNCNPRKILMADGSDGRTLAKSNSLPPIYSPRLSSVSMSSANTCVPSCGVGCQEKKANIMSTRIRMDKALFSRQKQGRQPTATAQMICNGLAVLNDSVQIQLQNLRRDSLKIYDPSAGFIGFESNYICANERSELKDLVRDCKGRSEHSLYDSAIEMENDKEMMDIEEDEYYTNQRIMAWVVKVNASLFSQLNDEIVEHTLEEQDVDTIKIIYDQD